MSASIKDRVTDFGQARWADFRGFTAGQKAVAIAALVALLVGGYLLATWQTTPTYAPLYTNLAASDASAIVDKLNASGVSYKLAAGGTEIMVPQSKVYSTRLTISAAGLPNSGETGYNLLDKEGVTTSQFKQQVDYQRAIEGELARTIQSVNGVQAASVHLAIPQQDVFNDNTVKPSAAVLLSVAPGTQLSGQQVQSIVYLVSSSVPQMTTANVTVTDSNGAVLKAPGDTMAGGADSQAQMTQDYDNRLAASLQAMLDRAIGTGHAVITVNSQLDFNKTSITDKQYVYDKNNPPVSESKTTEVYNGAGAGPAGTLGTTQTSTSASASATPGKYSKTSVTVDNALGTVTKTTENSPGALQSLSVAVMLDSTVKGLNVAKIANLVKSGVGFNSTRGDQLSVQAVPFDNSAQKQATLAANAAAKAAAAKASQAKLISLAKQGGLALLVLIALIWVWLGGRKRKKNAAEPNDDILPSYEDDDELLSGPATSAQERPLRSVPDNGNLRHSLATVADNRPKDVARLLSDWLETKDR